jgi:hypothetical protein
MTFFFRYSTGTSCTVLYCTVLYNILLYPWHFPLCFCDGKSGLYIIALARHHSSLGVNKNAILGSQRAASTAGALVLLVWIDHCNSRFLELSHISSSHMAMATAHTLVVMMTQSYVSRLSQKIEKSLTIPCFFFLFLQFAYFRCQLCLNVLVAIAYILYAATTSVTVIPIVLFLSFFLSSKVAFAQPFLFWKRSLITASIDHRHRP